MSELLYHLNSSDEIASVNEAWLRFARSNGGEAVHPTQVVGRSLWVFIADMETRHIYRTLHGRVRERRRPIRFSFRCDAPERRRLLELDISPAEEQGLVYRVLTVREQERDSIVLLEPGRPRSEVFVRMCSWCKRVAVPPHGWLELEEAVLKLALFDHERPPQLTHGICEDCNRGIERLMSGDAVRPVMGAL